jgi:hypothetical protein
MDHDRGKQYRLLIEDRRSDFENAAIGYDTEAELHNAMRSVKRDDAKTYTIVEVDVRCSECLHLGVTPRMISTLWDFRRPRPIASASLCSGPFPEIVGREKRN